MTTVVRPDLASYELLRLTVDVPESRFVTVTASGELDLVTTPRFERIACSCLDGYRPRQLTMDMTEVRFFCCAAVSALLRIDDAATTLGATVHLIATDVVLRPLRLLDLDRALIARRGGTSE